MKEELLSNPAFIAYTISVLLLTANLSFLWAYSGGVRGKSKTTRNPEDAQMFSKGTAVVAEDPAEVARVLRAHANALANIVPFLFLGLIYTLLGASGQEAWIFFGIFSGARWLHTISYLAGKQPFRTLSFGIGGLTTLALMIRIITMLL